MTESSNAAARLEAAEALADLDASVWFDNAEHFNCIEADVIAKFLTAYGGDGDSFLASHSIDDDEGDRHKPVWDEGDRLVGWEPNGAIE